MLNHPSHNVLDAGLDKDNDGADGKETIYRYVLDLSKEPASPQRTWIIGRGNSKLPNEGVDVLLKASGSLVPPYTIALIWIHPRSGAFMLQAISSSCPIRYLSGLGADGDLTLQAGEKTVLWMRRNHLRFGLEPLDFVLDVAVEQGPSDFILHRNRFLRAGGSGQEPVPLPSKHLVAYPDGSQIRMHDLIIQRADMATGGFGRVSAGLHAATGLPIAVKVAHTANEGQIPYLKDEITIANLLSPHPNIVPFLDTWCDHGSPPPCFACPIDKYYMSMPLAVCSFESFFKPASPSSHPHDAAVRLRLFRDITNGLARMHACGIMHRDISPKNLLVLLAPVAEVARGYPFRASICDFGKAIEASRATDTAIGPIHTVAPEVWTMPKNPHADRASQYTNAVDMWSLGYAHLYILRRPQQLGKTDRRRHGELVGLLEEVCAEGQISEIEKEHVRSLLTLDPAQRPSATKALKHPVWELCGPSKKPVSEHPRKRRALEGPRKEPATLHMAGGGGHNDLPDELPDTESFHEPKSS
ncbi:kinase-like domain-containing protein [Astrocystis sublimbata]|nr:kinase-like domain-containing protein [Astrocystis sublimbata]